MKSENDRARTLLARRGDYSVPMRTRRHLAGFALVLGSALGATAAPARAQEVGFRMGQLVPDIVLPTIDGEGVVRLSDLRGRRVLLIEFASW